MGKGLPNRDPIPAAKMIIFMDCPWIFESLYRTHIMGAKIGIIKQIFEIVLFYTLPNIAELLPPNQNFEHVRCTSL